MELLLIAPDSIFLGRYFQMVMTKHPDKSRSNDSENGNDIEPPFKRRLTIMYVTDEAERIAKKFHNPEWQGFYAKAFYWLGDARVHEIERSVSDSKYPGQVFSKAVKQEITVAQNKGRLERMRKNGAS